MLHSMNHIYFVLYILVDDLPMYVNKDGRPVEYIEQAALFSTQKAMREFADSLQERQLLRAANAVRYDLLGAEVYLNVFFNRNVLK